MTFRTYAIHRPWAGVLLALLGLSLAGCNIVKLIGVLGEDPKENVKAQYSGLPGNKLAVVAWVPDDINFEYPYAITDITEFSNRAIDRGVNKGADQQGGWGKEKQKPVTLVPASQIRKYQESSLGWDQESPSHIGEKLGADLLLWVDLTEFSTRVPDSPDIYRGQMQASLTLYEVHAEVPRKELWRGEVKVVYPEKVKVGLQDSNDARIRQGTLDAFSSKLAKFFYDHEEVVKKENVK